MKKSIVNKENPNGISVEMTTEEVSEREADIAKAQSDKEARLQAKQANEDLKASAKTKLMAGEKLTEEEANILVGV